MRKLLITGMLLISIGLMSNGCGGEDDGVDETTFLMFLMTGNNFGSSSTTTEPEPTLLYTAGGTCGSGIGQLGYSAPTGAYGIALDTVSSAFYVSDTQNDRILKYDLTGNYLSTFGSTGSANGQLNNPNRIAVDSSGNVYVADTLNSRVQKFDSSGAYVTQWGSNGSGNGQFSLIWGLTVDASDNVYTTETSNARVQKFTSSGVYVTQWGTSGTGNGEFTSATAIDTDTSGNVYVVDSNTSGEDRVQKFTSSGTYIEKFVLLGKDIDLDSSGNMYVPGGGNTISQYSSSGASESTYFSGTASPTYLDSIFSVAVDSSSNPIVYGVSEKNCTIYIWQR